MSSDQPAAERPPVTPPAGSSPFEKRRAGKPAKSLDAPHRRRERGRGPRPLEKTAIVAYRAGMGLMSRLPVTVVQLDRIMVTPELGISDSGVHQSATAKKASDHYPIWAVVEKE